MRVTLQVDVFFPTGWVLASVPLVTHDKSGSEKGTNSMSEMWPHIRYRDFYDVPRAIVVLWNDTLYLFDCLYDYEADDYAPAYTVYRLPADLESTIDQISWTDLGHRGLRLGSVPTSLVELDRSRRLSMNPAVFEAIE